MIWIPPKDKCEIWNETENGRFILFFLDKEEKKYPIEFFWHKPSFSESYDPFYLFVRSFCNEFVQHCNMINCGDQSYPQLRYNAIIDKWFCTCASSAICTENNDKDEIEGDMLKHLKGDYSELSNTPFEAIIQWNLNVSRTIKEINEHILKEIEEDENYDEYYKNLKKIIEQR